ncbi:MAG: hypothetical protein H7Z43_08190, partial [Clostridia bacterium]|nr:hypothetical protein [Deltaproteobacteria bacterium]
MPLSYPANATSLAAANFSVTVPLNTATHAAVPVVNPRSDLVVTVVSAPAHGMLAPTTTFVGLLYTPNAGYLGPDAAVVVVTASGDSTIQLPVNVTFSVEIPFEIIAPDGITAMPGVAFAFNGGNTISLTHSADANLELTQTLTTDLGTLSLGVRSGITFGEDAANKTSDGVDDATIVFSGDLAAVNAALGSLTLRVEGGTDVTRTGTLTIKSSDGALDSFGNPRAPQIAAVDLALSAEPPTPLNVTGPSSQTTLEDTALVFSQTNGSKLVIKDDEGAAASAISVT